jgi:hypothetical protein
MSETELHRSNDSLNLSLQPAFEGAMKHVRIGKPGCWEASSTMRSAMCP